MITHDSLELVKPNLVSLLELSIAPMGTEGPKMLTNHVHVIMCVACVCILSLQFLSDISGTIPAVEGLAVVSMSAKKENTLL